MVSRPNYVGGLGFGLKWDMGWMHDTLKYMATDPIYRKYHHNDVTFRMMYAFSENFVLPLSHDEIVHGKGSCSGKCLGMTGKSLPTCGPFMPTCMPTREKAPLYGWRIRAMARMEPRYQPDWHLLQYPALWFAALGRGSQPPVSHRTSPARGRLPGRWLSWIDCTDGVQYSQLRADGKDHESMLMIVANFTPVPRHNYRIGPPVDSGKKS